MAHNVNVTFVSEKVNVIRWRPDPFNNVHSFLTGSYENSQNSIRLWDFQESEDDNDLYPFSLSSIPYDGDVTQLKCLNPDIFVSSSSTGTVNLFKINSTYSGDISIKDQITWANIHKFPNGEDSPCTGFSVYETDIATVGEDGSINLLTSQSEQIVRKIENADSCSIKCVTFLKHNELLTSNLRGQMKIWDIRSQEDKPVNTFMLSGDQVSPTCIEFHPTQRHLIIAGDEEGSLTVWDVRHNLFPINSLNAHEDSVLEIQFHPDHPDQLFSCSSAGEIWHWSAKSKDTAMLSEDSDSNVWLASENVKNKMEVFALMSKVHKPINSLDVNKDRVLCSCDNEAVYLINGINLHN